MIEVEKALTGFSDSSNLEKPKSLCCEICPGPCEGNRSGSNTRNVAPSRRLVSGRVALL